MKEKVNKRENYLEKIPCVNNAITWSADESGILTLEIENKGIFNTIAQKFFKRPRVSYIHLDENGSFIWPLIDGVKSILDISKEVDAHFGEAAHPLYERLSKFFQILESYKFIYYK